MSLRTTKGSKTIQQYGLKECNMAEEDCQSGRKLLIVENMSKRNRPAPDFNVNSEYQKLRHEKKWII
jgi:hypothetical protein